MSELERWVLVTSATTKSCKVLNVHMRGGLMRNVGIQRRISTGRNKYQTELRHLMS